MSKLPLLVFTLVCLIVTTVVQAQEFTQYEERMLEAYLAYYGRPPDPSGLDFWAGKLEDEGGNLDSVIDAFGTSAEFDDRFGDLTDTELVNNLFVQIYGRDADPAGLDYYVNLLETGESNLQKISIQIIDGRQNEDVVIVDNRLDFSGFYVSGAEDGSIEQKTDVELATIMATIDDTEESVDQAFLTVHGANGINGGRLYSKFWADETGFTLENSSLQSQEELDGITARSDFFRCKQCHGWDRLGREGGYSNRAPKTSRPNVADLDVQALSAAYSVEEMFAALKTGVVARRDVDLDLSMYDPDVDPTLGDMMPDYSQILTDGQIWDLVAYLKNEALDTTQLYDIALDDGVYPSRGRTFSNLGKDGDAVSGDAIYAGNCATCHGADGTAILVDGGEYTVGAHLRAKPYEDQHKVKFGHLGSIMGSILANSPIDDIRDLFKALASESSYPSDEIEVVTRALPTLQGHMPLDPEEYFHGDGSASLDDDRILPYEVQAAFNDDTFFWRVSYRGEEGKRHEYIRYTNGAWQREGGDRRDAQATIDGDAQQGDTNINSTIYEQRTTIMINDPNAATDVTNFGEFGCFLACHNDSRHMPEWVSASGHDGKYIDPEQAPGVQDGDPVLDLWHWRGARSNPIGRADDQNILAKTFVDSSSGDDGGRKGDAGTGVFKSQNIVDGHPEYVVDPDTSGGSFAFKWEDFWNTPLFFMTQEDAADIGPYEPNPVIMAWDDAIADGYQPTEGDTVPRRIHRAGEGSRADITAYGTTYTPEAADNSYGLWNVQMQRALDTGNADDIALVPGQVYEAGFEAHLWEYTTRDHYVSFPVTLQLVEGASVGPEEADVQAVRVEGSGPEQGPDWSAIPVTTLQLFQPGITTWEFLTGANQGKEYIDAGDQIVDQSHGGSGSVNNGDACTDCHNVRDSDPDPSLFDAGAMEDLTDQRGGIWEDTPVVELP